MYGRASRSRVLSGGFPIATPATPAEWVTAIDAAINACLLGQSYTLPSGQSVSRPNLRDLWKLREFWNSKDEGGDIPVNYAAYGNDPGQPV